MNRRELFDFSEPEPPPQSPLLYVAVIGTVFSAGYLIWMFL